VFLAYLTEIHEVVVELCQIHVLSSFYLIEYEIKQRYKRYI